MDMIEFGVGETDRDRLVHFVDSLEKFLSQLIQEASNRQYFIPGFEDEYRAAWEELKPSFSALRDATLLANPNALLVHGLYGKQLDFKLKVINHFSKAFSDLAIDLNPIRKIKKLLKKLLEALDKFLASLLDAVGAGGAVAEYKDFLESIIDDEEDD